MQFYKEHIDLNILDKTEVREGILNNIDDKYYINDIEVINNRGIFNDIVYINSDNNVISIKERDMKYIVGILYLDSKVIYGNYKNKLLYLFKPTNKRYTNFYVPYEKKVNCKLYVIIQFNRWLTTDKLPIGTLIETIGPIGSLDADVEHLRNYYEIRKNTWKISPEKKNQDLQILTNLQTKVEDYTVFSIDPIGSNDIDDAFHFKIIDKESQIYEVGIHIASPFVFFKDNMREILERASTVYLTTRKYNMIPNIYAENYVSLLENHKRFALSLIIKICRQNNENNATHAFQIMKYDIQETVVLNTKNFNYEEFDAIYNKIKDLKDSNNLRDFYDFTMEYFNCSIDTFDSHKLVENWMILANQMVASHLIKCKFSNTILRKHVANDDIIYDETNEDIKNNKELTDYLKLRRENSALYEIYDANITEELQTHSKLENKYYTHFTSPIRRAVDTFIHSLLITGKDQFEREELEKNIEYINKFTKNCRKFDRNIKRLDFLYGLKGLKANIITFGHVIEINESRLKVYLPEYKMEEKIIIIPYKFKNIAIVDEINENFIKYTLDNRDFQYTLYQRLELKLWILTSVDNIFEKLKIEIL